MSLTYGFFNSVNGDRKYNAEQMSEYFRGIINEGVYQNLDGGLAVTAGTGLAVSVASGRAIVQNRWVQNSEALSLTISSPSEVYARKDAVVIRLNWNTRLITIAVKTGTPAASPEAPELTRTSEIYEMALAYISVSANATSVTVTDKRSDTTVCGWVSVAQATSGEVDAMLNAMKTGFDGVTYSSPAEQVIGSDEKIIGMVDDVDDKVGKYKNIIINGNDFDPYDVFVHGLRQYANGEINPALTYGVSSVDTITFTNNTRIHMADGYYCILYFYNGTTYTGYENHSGDPVVTVPANSTVAVSIRKTVEDQSVVADIATFLAALTIVPYCQVEIDNIKTNTMFADTVQWINGTLDMSGNISTSTTNRIVTPDYYTFNEDVVIMLPEGFKGIRCLYASDYDFILRDVYNYRFIFVPKGVYARFSIMRITEKSETASISEFTKNLSLISKTDYIKNSKLDYIKEYRLGSLRADTGAFDPQYTYAWTPAVDKFQFTHDVYLNISDGMYIFLSIYDNQGTQISRTAKYPHFVKIPAGTIFNFTIRNYNDPDETYSELYVTCRVWFEHDVRREKINYMKRRPLLTIVDDDGAKEFYDYMLPIIKGKGIPITTAFPASTAEFATNVRTNITSTTQTMTLSELKECVAAGAEVIGHGLVDLRTLSEENADNELRETKRKLQDYGLPTNGYAYPDGGDSETIRYLTNKYYDYGIWRTDQTGQIFSNDGNIADYQIIRFQFGGYYNIENGRFVEEGIHPYTIDAFKMALDEAIENNAWLVLCTHAWLMVDGKKLEAYENIDQYALLESAIDYAKAQGVDIVTCEEGYRVFGNAVIAGDYLGAYNTSGYSINKEGHISAPTT